MTLLSTASSEALKLNFADYLAAQVNAFIATKPNGQVTGAAMASMINDYEQLASTRDEACRVTLLPQSREQEVQRALEAVEVLDREFSSPNAMADNDPALKVAVLLSENAGLKSEVEKRSLSSQMLEHLVGLVAEMLPAIERSGADPKLIASIKGAMAGANEIKNGNRTIAASISPYRIINTIEEVSNAHQRILMRYKAELDSESLVQGIRVVGDAMKLLEDIQAASQPSDEVPDDAPSEQHR